MSDFPARLERFATVDSTQRVVAGWLAAGEPEVAVAVADVQTRGRGRLGRSWEAPAGFALLASCGFRPVWLPPEHAWRLGAIVALAMLDAAEEVAGLRLGSLELKWPNDLVARAHPGAGFAKLAGVLGESTLEGGRIATAVIGIGVNVDWPETAFPAQLAERMTSLRILARGRPVDRDALLVAFLGRVEPRYEALRAGRFDHAAWAGRQCTVGRRVAVARGTDPVERVEGIVTGVEPGSGALLLETAAGIVQVDAGEVVSCTVVRL